MKQAEDGKWPPRQKYLFFYTNWGKKMERRILQKRIA